MRTQDKFMDLLRERAEERDLDFVVDLDTGRTNVGTCRFQRPGAFQSVLSLDFEFQEDRMTLYFEGPLLPPSKPGWKGMIGARYGNGLEMQAIMTEVDERLKGCPKVPRTKLVAARRKP